MKLQMDFEDPNFYPSRVEAYKYLLENEPCWWSEINNCWVITRYDDVTDMLKNHETFTTKYGTTLKHRIPYGQTRTPIRFNEQDHKDYISDRLAVSKIFNYIVDSNLEDYIKDNTRSRFNEYLNSESFDIVSSILLKLPVDVICELLGVDEDGRDYLVQLSESIFYFNEELEEEEVLNKVSLFLLENTPKNIKIVSDEKLHGKELSIREKILYSLVFMIAGQSTAASAMVNLMYDVISYNTEFEKVKKNKTLMVNFIEESLRFSNAAPGLVRTCTKDYEIHNKVIKEGDSVLISFGAANLDPQKWGNNSYSFCIDRDFGKQNLAFGHGPHQCMGIKLARMQLTSLLEELINLKKIKVHNIIPKFQFDITGTCWKNIYVELN